MHSHSYSDNYFSIGKIPSNKKKDNNDNILNSLQGMSKIFFTQQNTENNCEINSNHQFNFNTFNSQNNYCYYYFGYMCYF